MLKIKDNVNLKEENKQQADIIKNSVSKDTIKSKIEFLYREREKAEELNKMGTGILLTGGIETLENLLEEQEGDK